MSSSLRKTPDENPSESKWSILQGKNNGKPMYVRRNDDAQELASSSEYRYRVGVAIPLLAPNEVGLPSNEEMESLNQIEDELSTWLEQDEISVLVLAITTSGMREFIFYTRDPNIVENAIKNVRSKFSSHKIQCYVKEDKEWSVYRQFA